MKIILMILICLFVQIKTNFAQTPAPIDLGLLNGKATNLVKPVYPETAKNSGIGGTVKVNVTVDEKGNIIKAEAVSGELLLRDASLAAARASQFPPYLVKGKAVKMSGFLVFNFIMPKSKVTSDSIDLGLLNNKAKTLIEPESSFEVIYENLSGEVKVNVRVDERGNVTKAEAVSGHEKLRPAAEVAATASKFEPYLIQGKAVKFSGFLVFSVGMTEKTKAEMDKTMKVFEESQKQEREDIQKLYDKGDYAGVIKRVSLKNSAFLDSFDLRMRAAANFKLENYNDALKDISNLINSSLFTPSAVDFTLRGDIYKAQYNNVAAQADYRKALELAPNDETIKQKLSSSGGQKVGDTTAMGLFQRDLKLSLAEFDRLKPDYEKKVAAFNALLEAEKKKTGNVDVTGLCQSLLAVKSDWTRLDPLINKVSDKISDLQKQGKMDEYFTGAAFQLGQTGEMLDWSTDKYLPEKRKYIFLFDKLECKALAKP